MRFFTDLLREINEAEARGNVECEQMNARRDIEEEYERTVEAQSKYLAALNVLSKPEEQQRSYVNEEWRKRTQCDIAEAAERSHLMQKFDTETPEAKRREQEMQRLLDEGWAVLDHPKI